MRKIINPTGKKLQAKVGRDARGSNQYIRVIKVRRPRYRAYSATITLGIIAAYILTNLWLIPFYEEVKFKPAYAPTVDKAYAKVLPTATPTPDPKQEIRDYVKEVFGKDADKAFKVLSCENNALNPKAVNTAGNFPEGSRDIGIFQINEYWQDVNPKFLFNWKTNIHLAHQIYTDSGNSFHLWTCGRKLGV